MTTSTLSHESTALAIEGMIEFVFRDEGWHEDDPDYVGETSIQSAQVRIVLPCGMLPAGGPYTIRIELQPRRIEEPAELGDDAGEEAL
jgi:hypothetical protein